MEEQENEWKDLIGISASIWTILQMISPLPTCYYFIKKQSVGDMVVTPYVVALTSCTLWLFYGLVIKDPTIVRVNTVGSTLQLCYTICYYIYCTKKAQVRKQAGAGFLVVLLVIFYSNLEANINRLVALLGFFCSCVTVMFFASPLVNMHFVIKTWNSESLPRLLITATFIVSVQWMVYGYLINDFYIMVTNFLGTLLSASQILMMLIIPQENNSKSTTVI